MEVSDATTFLLSCHRKSILKPRRCYDNYFIGQSDEKVKRGPEATTGSLSYDCNANIKGIRSYDEGLTQTLYNARRRIVRPFKP